MFEVVKGWGVWLETIEITGVKIVNGKLFKDLQTTFREQVHKEAELNRMQINNEISAFTNEFDQKRDQINRDMQQKMAAINRDFANKTSTETEKYQKEKLSIDDTIVKMTQDFNNWKMKEQESYVTNYSAETLKEQIESEKQNAEKLKICHQKTEADQESKKLRQDFEIRQALTKKKAEVELAQAKLESEKRNFDADMLKYEAQQTAARCYENKKFKEANLNLIDEVVDKSEALKTHMLMLR